MEVEPFSETFGPKAQRKRPRMDAGSFEELSKLGAAAAEQAAEEATESGKGVIGLHAFFHLEPLYLIFLRSQSR